MKKIIFLVGLFVLAQALSAQTVGFKAGTNFASQVWKYNGVKLRPNYRTGTLAGFTLNIEESKKFSVQLELSYSQMGFGETTIDGTKIPEGDFKYAKVGSAIKFHPIRALNIHAGTEFGFLFDKPKDLKYLAGPDFGFFFGTEYYFIPYVGVGTRYYLGISDVNEGGSSADGETLKQQNRVFQVYLAFRIPSRQLKEMGY